MTKVVKEGGVARRVREKPAVADRHGGMPFGPGCVVTLTCGGHKMTVLDCRRSCVGALEVDLIWSAYGDNFGKATIPAACIVRHGEGIPF